MDRLISEHLLKTRLSTGESRPKEITSELIKDIFTVIDAIPSAEPTLDSIRKSIEEYVCNVETDTAWAQKMLNAWRAIEYDEPLPSADKWIPVSERLPEEFKSVLVCYKSQGGMAQCVSERFVNMDGSSRWSAMCGQKPIAWMPLPKPYEPQERSDKE